MQLTITTDDERVAVVEIDGDEIVDSLKAILEVETGVPMAEQAIFFNSGLLNDSDQLSSKGVKDGDLLIMTRRVPEHPTQGHAGGQIQELMNKIRNDPMAMSQLEANNPSLASAIKAGDLTSFAAEINKQNKRDRQLREEERKLEQDPYNAEAQAKIEEIIRQKNVEENFMQAMEHSPEVFGQITMLYVNMEVNGIPVQAFVDSGAQMTIMTQEFAEKCGIMRLVDRRFQGMAVGVGSSKIIGRVHQCPLKVQESFISSSVTILEQKTGPPFILGLDNMFRHQCCVDLKDRLLRFGSCNAQLPFLSEREIQTESKFEAGQVPQGAPDSSGPSQPPASGQNQSASDAAENKDGFPEDKIRALMDLGFDKAQCIQALTAAQGNEEAAASILFGNF